MCVCQCGSVAVWQCGSVAVSVCQCVSQCVCAPESASLRLCLCVSVCLPVFRFECFDLSESVGGSLRWPSAGAGAGQRGHPSGVWLHGCVCVCMHAHAHT